MTPVYLWHKGAFDAKENHFESGPKRLGSKL